MIKKILSLLLCCILLAGAALPIALVASAETIDAEFEASLTAQNFPESYKVLLREIHKKYPNWKFTSVKTGLAWSNVVYNEFNVDDSFIGKNETNSWKTYDKGYYNFATSTFNTYDGGAYHKASKEYLEYCLDPRNFINENYIFMFMKAHGQSGETVSGINNVLSGLNWVKSYPNTDEIVYFFTDGSYKIVSNKDKEEDSSSGSESTPTNKYPISAVVAADGVRVRADSNLTSAIVETLSAGKAVTVTGEKEGTTVSGSTKWYSVSYDGKTGYIHSSLVTLSAAQSISEETETTSTETSSEESSSEEESSSSDTSSDSTSSDDGKIDVGEILDGKTVKEIYEINSYGDAFYAAHKITGISAYMLASRIRQEQGLNGNSSGMGTVPGYEGYYNFWNIKTAGNNKYVEGAKYAKQMGWDTPLKSIIGGSDWLNTNYFKADQDTLYLQKFDVTQGGNGLYWHEYMTYLPAPQSEALILKRGFTAETIQNEAVFRIPVYNNMPETACPCPPKNGTNNNYLKSIEIKDYSLTNAFDVYTYSYEAIVENKAEKVEIIAIPYDSGAKVNGGGEVELQVGNNLITLEVVASNGAKRNYTLSIFRKEPDPEIPEENTGIEITTEYTVGDYVTKIEPNTTVETFLEKFTVNNGTVKLLGADDAEKAVESLIATGDKVVLYDTEGAEQLRYEIVIYGDVNKDGKVTTVDLLVAQRHIVGLDTLSDIQVVAGNSNKDSSLSTVDLLITQRFIVGITTSIQGS